MSKNRFYPDEDINDLVLDHMDEDSFYKGGPGSGIRGHRTQRENTQGMKRDKDGSLYVSDAKAYVANQQAEKFKQGIKAELEMSKESKGSSKPSPEKVAQQFVDYDVKELTEEIRYRERLASSSDDPKVAKYHEEVADALIELRSSKKTK